MTETAGVVERLRLPEQWRSFPDPDDDAPRDAAAEIERLRAALDHIRLECEATHTGQERAYTALSRIDGIARRALA